MQKYLKKIAGINFLLLVALLFLIGCSKVAEEPQPPAYCGSGIHYHADLKIFIDETELNLYVPENMEKDEFIHFHDGKNQENVIHFHKEGSLADFLNTINYDKLKNCILSRSGNRSSTLYYFYVNGKASDIDFSEYVIKDFDKLLIKCGSESPTIEQIESVGDLSQEQKTEAC